MRYQKVSMQRRRVTVDFGAIRVVVPWPDDSTTVEELAKAAIIRYKKAVGKVESDVRIIHLKCISDDGILDPDDCLIDVFDETTDKIVAILDEDNSSKVCARQTMTSSSYPHQQIMSPASSSSYSATHSPAISLCSPSVSTSGSNWHSVIASPAPRMSSSTSLDFQRKREHFQSASIPSTSSASSFGKSPLIRVRDSVVEITGSTAKSDNGLRVFDSSYDPSTTSSSSPHRASIRSTDTALKTEQQLSKRHHRVTMSPEVEKRLALSEEKESKLQRSSARKSKISESFYNALDRLGQPDLLSVAQNKLPHNEKLRVYPHDQYPNYTTIEFINNEELSLGIEVSGVIDLESSFNSQNTRLQAVGIISIDPEGCVGRDGQLRVGDNIIEIDGRPVYQMSVLRARAYLSDLGLKVNPRLTIARPFSSFTRDENVLPDDFGASSQKKLILSALQQANTQAIGETTLVSLTKSNTGFGFTVTGRETAKGERLFYIGTVKPNGPALGYLKAGDKLLEINGEATGEMTQGEVVDRLKKADVGDTVSFLVSRVSTLTSATPSSSEDTTNEVNQGTEKTQSATLKSEEIKPSCNDEIEFHIPLNNTGSAGLGLSLKARVTVRSDKSREDCGIFIKNVLNGGAACKDGRLCIDDRIMGIEDLRFDNLSNAIAGEAITKTLKEIGPTLDSVRVFIQRCRVPSSDGRDAGRIYLSHSPNSERESHSTDIEKRSSINSELTSFSRLDESELPFVEDAFDREAPTRKSLSEKRGARATNDPSHIKLFQDIKHKRQTSAPPASLSSSSSFHGQQQIRSASQRAAARLRSHSVHPRQPTHGILRNHGNNNCDVPKVEPVVGEKDVHFAAAPSIGPPMRRSLSVESINTASFNVSSRIGSNYNDKMLHFAPVVAMQPPIPIYASSPHPYPPGTSSSNVVHTRNTGGSGREKLRRKSMGSAFRSFFGMGKSTEDSPDYDERHDKGDNEEERWRLQDHYDRLRQREVEGNNRSPSTPNTTRKTMHTDPSQQTNNYTEFEPIYAQNNCGEISPLSPPLIVANSRFYSSQRVASTSHRTPLLPARNMNCSIDTEPIDIQKELHTSRQQHQQSTIMSSTNRRSNPITTLFPAQGRLTTKFQPEKQTKSMGITDNYSRNAAAIMLPEEKNQSGKWRQPEDSAHRHPTTTIYSTHGSPIAAVVRSEPPQPLRRSMEGYPGAVGPSSTDVMSRGSQFNRPLSMHNIPQSRPIPVLRTTRPQPTPPHIQHQHQSSTPIAFPTTRFAFAPTSSASLCPHSAERLSLRARKKLRREVKSMASIPSSSLQPTETGNFTSYLPTSPLKSTTELATISPQSSPLHDNLQYCNVWNDWSNRAGSSLPARRPRSARPKVASTLFEGVTDC